MTILNTTYEIKR